MPTPKALVRILTAERLEGMRPSVQIPVDSDAEIFSAAPLLNAVIAQAPTQVRTPTSTLAMCDLDDGRVILRDAIRLFGWNESTQLSFTVEGNHVSVCAVSGKGSTIESKQGRCLIPLAIRRRLSMGNHSTVLVVAEQTPAPHVRIYSSAHVDQVLRKDENK